MVAVLDEHLGIGIYTPAEAAFYARIRTARLSRWLFGDNQGDRVIRPELSNSEKKTVTFLDFVQAMAIRAILVNHPKVSLQSIRSAVEYAKSHFGYDYPFAMKHTTWLLNDNRILIQATNGELVETNRKHHDQRVMHEIVETYLQDLCWDDQTGIANKYIAHRDGKRQAVMDPKIRFGEPIINSCGYTAFALVSAVQSEGSRDAAAYAYGVDIKDIDFACAYFDRLQGNLAA